MTFTPSQLADREAIRDVVLRYCRGVDRLDEALMKSAYWPEATDHHGSYQGDAMTFVEHCMVAHLRWRATQHCITNHSIELDADGTRATGEVYNLTYLFRKDAEVLDTWWGRYLDRYEKRAGEWRIIERICVHEGTRSAPVADAMPIDAARFIQGDVDRGVGSRPLGPRGVAP